MRLRLLWSSLFVLPFVWAQETDGDTNKEPMAPSSKSAKDYYVWDLPGLDKSTTTFHSMHAGNIVIKPEDHGSLFFWSVDAQYTDDRPRTILWLNGGPGCSSMDGALMEVGPYRVRGEKIEDNPGSWNEYSNLLFVDQPVGVGYSDVESSKYIHDLDAVAADMLLFLDKWFEIFPERLSDEFYIAGESYAGQYIPYIAQAILARNRETKPDSTQHINLKGLMIGNGWVSPVEQYTTYLPFAYNNGLIKAGSEEAQSVEKVQDDCIKAMAAQGDKLQVHLPACEAITNTILAVLKDKTPGGGECLNIYDIRLSDTYPSCGMNWPPDISDVTTYLQRTDVQKALHATAKHGWRECSGPVGRNFNPENPPAVQLLPSLVGEIPVMMFSGSKDYICNTLGTETYLERLEWNGDTGFKSEYEEWVGGTYKSERNMSLVIVDNASHMVPFDFPDTSRFMLHSFLGLQAWDGSHNLSSTSPHEHERQKEQAVSDATWRAYYRSGTVALIVLLIILAVAAVVWWRTRHYTHYSGGNDDSSRGGFVGFLNGIARWKPSRSPSGGVYSGLNTRRGFRRNPDVILEEEEEDIESPLRYSYEAPAELDVPKTRKDKGKGKELYVDDSNTELEEFVVESPTDI